MAAVAGTFADRASAEAAVERLRAIGVPSSDVSLIVRQPEAVAVPVVEGGSATAAGVATGGLLGGLGGLLVGLGLLVIPGVGPVLAAGPLAATLGGMVLGAATGGLVGALVDLGVPEEYATAYVTDVERGYVLLAVHTDEASQAKVRDVMAAAGATNLYPSAAAV